MHGAQPSGSYQTAALTVGAAVAFGAGVYALKGADAVRPCTRLPFAPFCAAEQPRATRRPAGDVVCRRRAGCSRVQPPGCRRTQGSEFFAGYLLEQSLSVDNLFVFVLLFGYFKARAREATLRSCEAVLTCRRFVSPLHTLPGAEGV